MQDLLWQLKDTDAFTVYMALAFTAAVFWFIREIVDAPMLAVVSVPFLIAGGVVSPLAFRSAALTLADDQDTNVAAMVAIGKPSGRTMGTFCLRAVRCMSFT